MMSELELNTRTEQIREFKEEAARTGAIDEPDTLTMLEEIGYRLPNDLPETSPAEDSLEIELTEIEERYWDGGQFTPAMLRARKSKS